MTTLCWVRHGETAWNVARRLQGQEDIPLNDHGRRQAQAVGRYLKAFAWDAMVSSPLLRAWETAEIIAQAAGLQPPVAMAEIIERNYGRASGLTPEERAQQFADGAAPDIEPLEAMRDRVSQALNQLRLGYPHQRVVIVSHGGTINTVLWLASNGRIGTGKTVLANASISVIRDQGAAWKIECFNKTVGDSE